jgi:hypothetical protein
LQRCQARCGEFLLDCANLRNQRRPNKT